MSILSLEYLLFTAMTFAAYYLFPLKKRWCLLLLVSILFYIPAGCQGMAYLVTAAAVTWSGALGIRALAVRRKATQGRLLLALVLLAVIGAMACFKYIGAVLEAVNALMAAVGSGKTLPVRAWMLPLGLSWFTFQSAGYVIDVYRGKFEPERNFCRYLLFVSFFPQMAQGPISTWQQLSPQLMEGHRLQPQGVATGFLLMIWGYFKKLVIADRLAMVTAYVTSGAEQPGWLILMGAGLYMVQLYADFSGGMDVIRGTARTLGIDMAENFRRPFFADSVSEYWRRWHISLGAWFRSYLLYPLTTSHLGLAIGRASCKRLGKKTGRLIPSALATVLIFLCIGVWHSANWNAALYGLYFGLVMSGAMLLQPVFRAVKKRLHVQDKGPLPGGLRLVRTWLLVMLPQFFAFTNGPRQAFALMRRSVRGWASTGFAEAMTAVMAPLEWSIALAAMLLLLAVDLLQERGADVWAGLAAKRAPLRFLVLIALILSTVVLGCYGDGFDGAAFLYAQF